MARAVVIILYALLITGAVALLFSSIPPRQPAAAGVHRRLGYNKLPSSPNFDPPLLEKTHRPDDAVTYFGEEGRFNITKRLVALFPAVDKSPADGRIGFSEMADWNVARGSDRLAYRTQKELLSRDRDGDGAVSFKEFFPQFSSVDLANNEMGHGQAGWWMELFKIADVNENGILDFHEFNNFLHPEDSHNTRIKIWLLKEKIKRMDDDGDERLDFNEFVTYAYSAYKTYVEFEKIRVPTAEEKFADLDVDHDNFLTVEELLPILPYLKPGELTYAKSYAHYLIDAADDDGDDHLTLQEMLNHETIFYTAIYDSVYESDYHDEL
ncbi:unnamed protein product [Linum trigynum]|uniref:EF-hand domain-containing protein n=1 Tax=Linum trigynum TaxID=586398 RepID=A0AAV2G1J0_9ROSI